MEKTNVILITGAIIVGLSIIVVELFYLWMYLKQGGNLKKLLLRRQIEFKMKINNIHKDWLRISEQDYDIYYDDTFGKL